MQTSLHAANASSAWRSFRRLWLPMLLLGVGIGFYALHFVHLQADFPNDSPWNDWSKYTDEGWYGDAAIRHFVLGHWYLRGDFNPAVALPIWPLLEAFLFRFTGVGIVPARALAVSVFGAMLVCLYALIGRFERPLSSLRGVSIAGPLAILLFCTSSFFFVFERLAILEPLLATLGVCALLAASALGTGKAQGADGNLFQELWPSVLLGLLLPCMVLTKTTAVALFPAVAWMLWHRSDYRARVAIRLAALPLALALLVWGGYVLLMVRPHYLEDYRYLFSANGYTGFQLQPLATVLANTFGDGQWMGGVLYSSFFVALLLALFTRPAFFQNPLVPCMLLWCGGYFFFLAYHNNLQPRYYLVLAVPVTTVVALAVEDFRTVAAASRRASVRLALNGLLVFVVSAILVPDVLLEMSFLLHPEYTFSNAASSIARIVRSDLTQPRLLLSVSGSDLTLMTRLPSIDDDFGTMDLEERVRAYRPGWYVAWNQIDDDKMDALTPEYQPVRVAAFPVMDDPDRDQLILYRLDPAQVRGKRRRPRPKPPKQLRTRLGQQPTTTQLQH